MNTCKKIFIIALVSSLINISVFAEQPKERNHQISVNPAGLLFLSVPLSYRVKLTDSMALGVHVTGSQWSFLDYWSVGGGLSTKFFLTGEVFEDSWFIEPGVHGYYSSFGKQTFWGIKPSVIAGYAWVWDSGFSLSLGLGAGYSINIVDSSIFNKRSFGLNGIMPAADFSLGWSF